MPNNITNVMEFDCSVERFKEIAEYVRGFNAEPLGHVDFNTLIPMPQDLDIEAGSRGTQGYEAYKEYLVKAEHLSEPERTKLEESYKVKFVDDPGIWELGKQYYDNQRFYGATTWYEWRYANWNTKWNAYDCVPIDPEDRRLEFLTAWDAASPILEAISNKYPDVEITFSWADEDIGYNVGRMTVKAGEVTGEHFVEGGSKEAYELAAEIMGDDLSDWGLVLSKDGTTYEYHEEEELPPLSIDKSKSIGDAR